MTLEVITGPMFSGKTEELIRRIKREYYGGKTAVIFRPDIDKRYSEEELISHSGLSISAIYLPTEYNFYSKTQFLNNSLGTSAKIIGIDEVQFLDPAYLADIMNVANQKRIIVTGLDTNYRYEPFGIVPILMALADKVDKLTAICNICGEEATRTQRLVNGVPASIRDEEIVIGGTDSYQARCRICHEVRA